MLQELYNAIRRDITRIATNAKPVETNSEAVTLVDADGMCHLVDLQNYHETPRFRIANPEFHSPESFVAYVKDHLVGRQETTRIFFSTKTGTGVAIFDHLTAAGNEPGQLEGSRYTDRASITLRKSPQLLRWITFTDQWITQEALADGLEENLLEIVEPDGATLIETAMNLSITRKMNAHSRVNRSDGTCSFIYSETDDPGMPGESGKASVPTGLTVRLPLFAGDAHVDLRVHIRYRLKDRHPMFFLAVPALETQLQERVEAIRDEISAALKHPVHLGRSNN